MNIFSDDIRRNPYPIYDQLRTTSPLFRVPPPFNGWMILDYESVKWALNDHAVFSSRVPAPRTWFIFFDPPAHSKLRALISSAFTPRMIGQLEPRIRQLTHHLLDASAADGAFDLATGFSIPLAMQVLAGMLGIPPSDWARYTRWSDTILRLSYSRSGGEEAERAQSDFMTVTAEMDEYLAGMIRRRRADPQDDLLTHLIEAEVDGEHLSQEEILGFFQLLVVAGQETTSDLINNTVLSLLEHPDELVRLRNSSELIPSAIEEVLRYRSPLQWMMRTPRRDVELHGSVIPAGAFVLPVIGSANRDPKQFPNPHRFDIARNPNPHVAFGHGIHFCLGAALSRMEARIALTEMLERFDTIELASQEPWKPRTALHVHGPESLPLRVRRARSVSVPAGASGSAPTG